MRAPLLLAALTLTGCSGPAPRPDEARSSDHDPPLTVQEERSRVAPRGEPAAMLRSGPRVPVSLPPGFTVYPAAKITIHTLVERAGERRMLLEFTTTAPVEQVMRFYRGQARAAGATLTVDLGSEERASIGGKLPDGGRHFTVAARRDNARTRVEFAAD